MSIISNSFERDDTMIISLKPWLRRGKYVLVFIILTCLISIFFQKMMLWIEPEHKYDQPTGEAIKAVTHSERDITEISMMDRLMFFYWYGE